MSIQLSVASLRENEIALMRLCALLATDMHEGKICYSRFPNFTYSLLFMALSPGYIRATNLYNMLPVRTAGQFEVLLIIIAYARQAKLMAMLASFFAGVDEWIKVKG